MLVKGATGQHGAELEINQIKATTYYYSNVQGIFFNKYPMQYC